MLSSKNEVLHFLQSWNQACIKYPLSIIPRDKNIRFLSQIGWNFKIARKKLKKLSLAQYVKGPIPDRDRKGDIWVFGIKTDRYEVYVKIKLYKIEQEFYPKCLSFHEAEYPLKYPFRSA